MNKITKIVSSSLLAAVALVATQASARSIPATMGHGYFGSEHQCFDTTDFGVTNKGGTGCTGARWFEVGIPYDGTGGKFLQANASSAGMQCFYTQVNSGGGGVVTGSAAPVTVNVPLGVTIGAGDFGKIQCRIGVAQTYYGVQSNPN